MKPLTAKWGFPRLSPRQVHQHPKHSEFFEENDNVSHSLLREVTQNAGDAAAGIGEPVTVRFFFGSMPSKTMTARYLTGLHEHLAACNLRLPDDPSAAFLAIEDFGTTGLLGSYGAESDDSNYIDFWKRYGQSHKGSEKGGRHGVGKSVLYEGSRIRSFFGLTTRRDDGKELLLGQAVMRPHRLGADHYDGCGIYSPTEGDHFPVPLEGDETRLFKEDFDLERHERPGFSLVVLYPLPEISEESLVEASVRQCFHQILSGRLVLKIGKVELTAQTLEGEVLKRPALRTMTAAIELSSRVCSQNPPRVYVPKTPLIASRLTVDDFSPEDAESMRTAFARQEIVSAKIPVEVKPRNSPAAPGDFLLHLQAVSDPELARETYVRGRVSVPKQGPSMPGKRCVGLLVADSGIVSTFLGDSEPPSHLRWVQNKLKDKYASVERSFHPIKTGLRDLLEIVSNRGEEKPIEDLLKRFFWTPERRKRDEKDEVFAPPAPPDLPPSSSPVEVHPKQDGFELRFPAASDTPESVDVELAYAQPRGKPRWDSADFDLKDGEIAVDMTGDAIARWEQNCIFLRKCRPGLTVTVRGFDPNRDLVIRVREVIASEERTHGPPPEAAT